MKIQEFELLKLYRVISWGWHKATNMPSTNKQINILSNNLNYSQPILKTNKKKEAFQTITIIYHTDEKTWSDNLFISCTYQAHNNIITNQLTNHHQITIIKSKWFVKKKKCWNISTKRIAKRRLISIFSRCFPTNYKAFFSWKHKGFDMDQKSQDHF